MFWFIIYTLSSYTQVILLFVVLEVDLCARSKLDIAHGYHVYAASKLGTYMSFRSAIQSLSTRQMKGRHLKQGNVRGNNGMKDTKKIFFQKTHGGSLESTLPDAINWRNQKKSARITFEAYHYQYPSTPRATLSYIFYLTPEKVIREVDYQRHSPFKSAQRYRHNRKSNLKSANCPYFQIMQVAQDLGLRLNTSKTKSTPETTTSNSNQLKAMEIVDHNFETI